MISLNDLTDEIKALEIAKPTSNSMILLSALYSIREKVYPENEYKYIPESKSTVESEINDILPTYNKYVEKKKEYHSDKISKAEMLKYYDYVLSEISDLISALYSNSDCEEERTKLKKFINSL